MNFGTSRSLGRQFQPKIAKHELSYVDVCYKNGKFFNIVEFVSCSIVCLSGSSNLVSVCSLGLPLPRFWGAFGATLVHLELSWASLGSLGASFGFLLGMLSSWEVSFARPGSIMVHFGASIRSMEVDVARPGSIMVDFGTSRQFMEVTLARPG